jgi:hypothetical protein
MSTERCGYNGLGFDFGRRQPLANRNRGAVDNRGNMIVHQLHIMVRYHFSHGITTDMGSR